MRLLLAMLALAVAVSIVGAVSGPSVFGNTTALMRGYIRPTVEEDGGPALGPFFQHAGYDIPWRCVLTPTAGYRDWANAIDACKSLLLFCPHDAMLEQCIIISIS